MGRREMRDALRSTWSVYDARRPVVRADFEASERAADGTVSSPAPLGDAPVESAAHSGVLDCPTCERGRALRGLS